MFKIKHSGSFNNTEKLFSKVKTIDYLRILDKYAREGVDALSSATPIDSGLTASSWDYEIVVKNKQFSISWTNSNTLDGVPVVILLQYGHGTKNGGYVQGQDFINPAIKPIFDKISSTIWKEVTSL